MTGRSTLSIQEFGIGTDFGRELERIWTLPKTGKNAVC